MTLYPKQIDKDMIETHNTLESSDIGCWYVIINGALHFVKDNTPINL